MITNTLAIYNVCNKYKHHDEHLSLLRLNYNRYLIDVGGKLHQGNKPPYDMLLAFMIL